MPRGAGRVEEERAEVPPETLGEPLVLRLHRERHREHLVVVLRDPPGWTRLRALLGRAVSRSGRERDLLHDARPFLEAHQELRRRRDRPDHEPLHGDGLHESRARINARSPQTWALSIASMSSKTVSAAGDGFEAGLLPRPEDREHDPAELGRSGVVASEDLHRYGPPWRSRVLPDLTLLLHLDAASPGIHLGEEVEIRHVEEDREPDAGDPAEDRVELDESRLPGSRRRRGSARPRARAGVGSAPTGGTAPGPR